MQNLPDHAKALEFFKDWSNYLLIASVGALGWVSTQEAVFGLPWLRPACIALLVISIFYGMFTLALIPLIAEQMGPHEHSIYNVRAHYRGVRSLNSLAGQTPPDRHKKLKQVCWPQHAAFLAAILLYAVGTAFPHTQAAAVPLCCCPQPSNTTDKQ